MSAVGIRFLMAAVLGINGAAAAAERILFMSLAPTAGRLYIAHADGTHEEPLTGAGNVDYNPAWSALGDWIAFTSERAGSADIYRVHPDGTGLERLTDDPAFDDQAAFSPDGRQIVFVSTRGGGQARLWILDLATRAVHPLTAGGGGDFRPAWSPDGQWIAFSSDRDSPQPATAGGWERLQLLDVYVVHPDGRGLRRISAHGGFCGGPRWSSDSASLIVYCGTSEASFGFRTGTQRGATQLLRLNVATSRYTRIAAGDGIMISPALLPSGALAWVGVDRPGVFYEGGRRGPKGDDLATPSWSPDGSRIVYSRLAGDLAVAPHALHSRDPRYELIGSAFFPAYDRSGQRFAVTVRAPGKTMGLYVVDEGQPPREVYRSAESLLSPQWTADGHQILVTVGNLSRFHVVPATRSGKAQLALLNADGTGLTFLTADANDNAFASLAPEGRRIVFRTSGPLGQGLRLMGLADHSITVLTRERDNFPAWSPRDNLIAFTRKVGDDFSVFTIHPDGSGLRRLTHTRGIDAHASFSPDGEHLVFTSSRAGFKDEALNTQNPQPYGDIFVMRVDGSEVEQLTDNQWEDGAPVWQPHGGH